MSPLPGLQLGGPSCLGKPLGIQQLAPKHTVLPAFKLVVNPAGCCALCCVVAMVRRALSSWQLKQPRQPGSQTAFPFMRAGAATGSFHAGAPCLRCPPPPPPRSNALLWWSLTRPGVYAYCQTVRPVSRNQVARACTAAVSRCQVAVNTGVGCIAGCFSGVLRVCAAGGSDGYKEQQQQGQGGRFGGGSGSGRRGPPGDAADGQEGDLQEAWGQLSQFLKGQCAGEEDRVRVCHCILHQVGC